MTLTEFVLARISEDGAEIGPASDCDCEVAGLSLRHGVRCPVRMLAEGEAKREVVAWLGSIAQAHIGANGEFSRDADTALRLYAAVHVDHPDYGQEWRL